MMTEYDQHGYQPYDTRGYQQYDQQQVQQQQQQQRSTVLERGRAVRLMRNGDPYFPGRTFVINQKKYPMLDVFLDDASLSLRANFGAVRYIYTPQHGTRLKDISDFEDHRTYVAGGGERFKKLHYLDIAEGKRVPHKGHTSPKLPPVRRLDVEGRALKLARSENMIIYVYRNGDPLTLPAKVLLVKGTLQNWESVLDEVTRKIFLPNSAVLKLYAMNGELITSAQQLEYNGMYVAAGKERFKRIDYPDPKAFSPTYSPKNSRKSYTKSDGTHTTTATSYGSTENTLQRRPPVREEYDFFNNKPQQHRRGPTKEIDLDRDDGGIYKGRTNHRERVREVNETRDTKVDLPIDYREVQTIDEENLYGNAEKPSRRYPQAPNQPFANSRQQPIKSPTKNYNNDDDNRYPYNTNRSNGYDNNYPHRTPTQFDDDRNDQQLPNLLHRQPLISSSTQTHQDQQRQLHQLEHEESNIDQYRQSSQMTERDYDHDDDNA
jgi:hypothetical protein